VKHRDKDSEGLVIDLPDSSAVESSADEWHDMQEEEE